MYGSRKQLEIRERVVSELSELFIKKRHNRLKIAKERVKNNRTEIVKKKKLFSE